MATVMVDVRKAVAQAREYLLSIHDMLSEPGVQMKDLRLEETELSEDRKYWLITFGFDLPAPSHLDPLRVTDGIGRKYRREYKVLKLDAQTGEVQSMKIREL